MFTVAAVIDDNAADVQSEKSMRQLIIIRCTSVLTRLYRNPHTQVKYFVL